MKLFKVKLVLILLLFPIGGILSFFRQKPSYLSIEPNNLKPGTNKKVNGFDLYVDSRSFSITNFNTIIISGNIDKKIEEDIYDDSFYIVVNKKKSQEPTITFETALEKKIKISSVTREFSSESIIHAFEECLNIKTEDDLFISLDGSLNILTSNCDIFLKKNGEIICPIKGDILLIPPTSLSENITIMSDSIYNVSIKK